MFLDVWVDKIRMLLQDAYAIKSFERGTAAQNGGLFSWEIFPVVLSFQFYPSTVIRQICYFLYDMDVFFLCVTVFFHAFRLKFLEEEGNHPLLLTRMKV